MTRTATRTAKDTATGLTELGKVYANPENADLPEPLVLIITYDKDTLLRVMRAIGGGFTKRFNDYSLILTSLRAPGVRVDIARDKVCKKTVTWDCEPMLSPDDEMEVDAAMLENVQDYT